MRMQSRWVGAGRNEGVKIKYRLFTPNLYLSHTLVQSCGKGVRRLDAAENTRLHVAIRLDVFASHGMAC